MKEGFSSDPKSADHKFQLETFFHIIFPMPPRVALNRKEEKRFRLRTLPFFSALMVIAIVRIMI